MTSITRQIIRSNPNYEKTNRPQYTEYFEDGSYKTLHATKGWQRVSASRIKAQEAMAQKFGFIR